MTNLAHARTIVHGHWVNDRIRPRLFRGKEHILVRETLWYLLGSVSARTNKRHHHQRTEISEGKRGNEIDTTQRPRLRRVSQLSPTSRASSQTPAPPKTSNWPDENHALADAIYRANCTSHCKRQLGLNGCLIICNHNDMSQWF